MIDRADDGQEVYVINHFKMFPEGMSPKQMEGMKSIVTHCMGMLSEAMIAAFREGRQNAKAA